MNEKMIKFIITIATLVGLCFSVFFFVDNRYARQLALIKLEVRVKMGELEEILQRSLQNMYFYRDLFRKYPNNAEIRNKLEAAEQEVKEIRNQLQKLRETQ